jgi:hypothetical protein
VAQFSVGANIFVIMFAITVLQLRLSRQAEAA